MKLELLPGANLMLIVMDGLGDRRVKELGMKTPLEAADKPNMDRMAKEGMQGVHYPLSPGIPVGSGVAHLLLFNYSLNEYPQRGVFEALGAGFELKEGDLAMRINFATMKNGVVVDRRAGREGKYLDKIAEELEEAFSENPFNLKIEVKHTTQHRGVIVVREWKREFNVEDTDPVKEGLKPKVPNGKKDIEVLYRFLHEKAVKVMKNSRWNEKRVKEGMKPANCILIRGAGTYFEVEPFNERNGLKGVAIADNPLYLGVAKFVGMETFWIEDEMKIEKAMQLMNKFDFIFVHFKKTDNAGHDGDAVRKKREIEKVDSLLAPLLKRKDITVAITGDHATPCLLKDHSGDAVPVLFWGHLVEPDDTFKFGERWSWKGAIGQIRARDIIPMLANLAGRMKEVGK